MRIKLLPVLALPLVLVAALPLAAQNLLVANLDSGTVSVFGPSLTLTGTYTVPAPSQPIAVAWSSAAGLAAVSNFNPNFPPSNAGRIDFFNPASNPPTTVGASVSTDPISAEDLVFSPNGACLIVTDGAFGDHVVSINVGTRTVVTILQTGGNNEAVEFIPNNVNNIILTADFFSNSIYALTMAPNCALTHYGTVSLPASPGNITALPNGLRALVANADGSVSVLSISGIAVDLVNTLSIGGSAQSIAVLPSGTKAYVSRCHGNGGVQVLTIDSSNNVTDSGINIPTSGNNCYFGVNQAVTDGNKVFVTGFTNVQIIAVGSTTVSGTITAGRGPAGLAMTGGVVGGCGPHTVHGHISTSPPSHSGNVSHQHHGQHGHTVAGNCPPHAPGHSAGLSPEPEEVLFAASASRARPGDVLQLFGSAEDLYLAEQEDGPASGFTPPTSHSRRYYTTSLPEVRIGGVAARVLFSGLAPGRKGVWQITIVLPQGLRAGQAPVTISYEGVEVQASDLVVE
jgi:hypothetical protein